VVGGKNRKKGMKPEHIVFPCGTLKLEGLLFRPTGVPEVPSVVVCHPHPLYGGTMHNNVTFAVAEALVKESMAALLFNFRGVGGSQGSYGGGEKEQEDVKAALNWLEGKQGVDKTRLGVAGYSFGAGVAFPAACADARVKAIALISPYFEKDPGGLMKRCDKPKLLITGSDDYMVTAETVSGYFKDAVEPKKLEVIDGADHFWGGFEREMAKLVAGFVKEYIPCSA
jgi:alpha/beta superfamily hydrolase